MVYFQNTLQKKTYQTGHRGKKLRWLPSRLFANVIVVYQHLMSCYVCLLILMTFCDVRRLFAIFGDCLRILTTFCKLAWMHACTRASMHSCMHLCMHQWFGHVSDMIWTCFRHDLDMFQTCVGNVLPMIRSCFGNVFGHHPDNDLGIIYTFFETKLVFPKFQKTKF